jgi:hypothetical protein
MVIRLFSSSQIGQVYYRTGLNQSIPQLRLTWFQHLAPLAAEKASKPSVAEELKRLCFIVIGNRALDLRMDPGP